MLRRPVVPARGVRPLKMRSFTRGGVVVMVMVVVAHNDYDSARCEMLVNWCAATFNDAASPLWRKCLSRCALCACATGNLTISVSAGFRGVSLRCALKSPLVGSVASLAAGCVV